MLFNVTGCTVLMSISSNYFCIDDLFIVEESKSFFSNTVDQICLFLCSLV